MLRRSQSQEQPPLMNYSILTSHLGANSAPQTLRNIRSGYRTYLLFGAPGSGKGTQGKALGSVPRFFHCACGDVFRSMDTRTKVGQAFIYYSSRGELVPDEISIELWKDRLPAPSTRIGSNRNWMYRVRAGNREGIAAIFERPRRRTVPWCQLCLCRGPAPRWFQG